MGVALDLSTKIYWIIRSPDGQLWERASQLPEQLMDMVQAGLIFSESMDGVWRASRDGSSWQDVHLPAGVSDIEGVVELSAGGYIASGTHLDETIGQRIVHILHSDDGLSWSIDDGDFPGAITDVTSVGDRLVASVAQGVALDQRTTSAPPTNLLDRQSVDAAHLWQSFDAGHTWSPLIGSDGKHMTGETVPVGDSLGVVVRDAQGYMHLAWVGTPGKSPAPATPRAATPTSAATPTLAATPTPTPTPTLTPEPASPTPSPLVDAVDPCGLLGKSDAPPAFPTVPDGVQSRGWRVVAVGWSGNYVGCSSVVPAGATKIVALSTCTGATAVDADGFDVKAKLDDPARLIGTVHVVCAKSGRTAPQVDAFTLSGSQSANVQFVQTATSAGTFTWVALAAPAGATWP
jgi:hypothetical protein